MKPTFVIVLFFMLSISARSYSQDNFAILEKNNNQQAKGLVQSLNATKDTLFLNSDSVIRKIYAVNMDYKREVDMPVWNNTVEVPLRNLSVGKHVFVAVQSDNRFVFVVKILGEGSTLASLEKKPLISGITN